MAKSYSVDDELLSRFSADIKQCMLAFQFLVALHDKLALKYWPDVLASAQAAARLLLAVLGEDALHFDLLALMYSQFDLLQSRLELVKVHPKERDLALPALHLELVSMCSLLDHLAGEVLPLAAAFAKEIKLRVLLIMVHLKHIRASIKARLAVQKKCAKLEKKVEKLEKAPTSDLLADARLAYEREAAKLEAYTSKLKASLPESLLLIEEFTDTLTKWAVCHHEQLYGKVARAFLYIAQFHGHIAKDPPLTEAIVDQWEMDATPARLRIESLLSAIYERNPDLLNEEIDGEDKTLKLSKMWALMTTNKKVKRHSVKPQDHVSGIFNDHLMADPLVSYAKYSDAALNASETYNPTKVVHVKAIAEPPARPVPPPLPPRDLTHSILLKSPQTPSSPFADWSSSYVPPSSLATTVSPLEETQSELSLVSDDSDSASVSLDTLVPDLGGKGQEKYVRFYNSQKNEITEAPLLPSQYSDMDFTPSSSFLDPKNSATLKLFELNSFFEGLLSSGQKLTATAAFGGQEAGDLAFQEGDEVEVLFDLQLDILSFDPSGNNWFVGAVEHSGVRRVGMAPRNYFN